MLPRIPTKQLFSPSLFSAFVAGVVSLQQCNAKTLKNLQGGEFTLFNILYLLAHLLDHDFEVNGGLCGVGVIGLG